jgi:hypothetical protein
MKETTSNDARTLRCTEQLSTPNNGLQHVMTVQNRTPAQLLPNANNCWPVPLFSEQTKTNWMVRDKSKLGDSVDIILNNAELESLVSIPLTPRTSPLPSPLRDVEFEFEFDPVEDFFGSDEGIGALYGPAEEKIRQESGNVAMPVRRQCNYHCILTTN